MEIKELENKVNKTAYILWIGNNREEPYEVVLERIYKEFCAFLITDKMIKGGEWENFDLWYPSVIIRVDEMAPLFHLNVFEWYCNKQLSDIRYGGWSLSNIMNIRNCDFFTAAEIMSIYIERGETVDSNSPSVCSLEVRFL